MIQDYIELSQYIQLQEPVSLTLSIQAKGQKGEGHNLDLKIRVT